MNVFLCILLHFFALFTARRLRTCAHHAAPSDIERPMLEMGLDYSCMVVLLQQQSQLSPAESAANAYVCACVHVYVCVCVNT